MNNTICWNGIPQQVENAFKEQNNGQPAELISNWNSTTIREKIWIIRIILWTIRNIRYELMEYDRPDDKYQVCLVTLSINDILKAL